MASPYHHEVLPVAQVTLVSCQQLDVACTSAWVCPKTLVKSCMPVFEARACTILQHLLRAKQQGAPLRQGCGSCGPRPGWRSPS